MNEIQQIVENGGDFSLKLGRMELVAEECRIPFSFVGPGPLALVETPAGCIIERQNARGGWGRETAFPPGHPWIPTVSFEIALPANAVSLSVTEVSFDLTTDDFAGSLAWVPDPEIRTLEPDITVDAEGQNSNDIEYYPEDDQQVWCDADSHTHYPFGPIRLGILRVALLRYWPKDQQSRFVQKATGTVIRRLDPACKSYYSKSILAKAMQENSDGSIFNLEQFFDDNDFL